MKVNRFTKTSNPRFDPMSLQELMMVPAYKRQQHDAISEGIATAETQLAQVDPLDIHSDLARTEQEQLYNEMSAQSEALNSEGFNNKTKSDFLKLNKQYQRAISPTGTIGRINQAKTSYNEEKSAYIANSTKMGYSPEAAAANWDDHTQGYKEGFDGKNVTNIEGLYAPEYKDAVTEYRGLLKEAGMSSSDISNIGSYIKFDDPRGTYVITKEGREAFGSNIKQIEAARDYMNNQINNPNSTIRKSLEHNRKTPDSVLNEVAGLEKVYQKDEYTKQTGSKITNFTPTKTPEQAAPLDFLHSKIRGMDVSNIDTKSPLLALDKVKNLEFDPETGSIVDKNGSQTYEKTIENIKKGLSDGSYVKYNEETGLYDLHSLASKNSTQYSITPIYKQGIQLKSDLDKVRNDNPQLANLTDAELVGRLESFREDLSSNYVGGVKPIGSNYGWLNDTYFGSSTGSGEKSTGTMSQNSATINGVQLTFDEVLDEFGWDNMQEFKENGNPSIEEFVPALGKWRATAYDDEGNQIDFFVNAPEELQQRTAKTQAGYEALVSGKSFAEIGTVNTPTFKGYMYIVNDFQNPIVVFSPTKVNDLNSFKGKDLQSMDYQQFSQLELQSLKTSNLFKNLSGIDKTNK